MRISNYFIKRKIENLAKKGNRTKTFKSLDEIDRAIIFCNSSECKKIFSCVSRLEEMGKKMLVCSYGGLSGKEVNEGTSVLEVSPQKDLNFFGMPSSSIIKKLNDFKPDILIDLTSRVSYPMEYLFLACECDFKTGIKKKDHEHYDFSISVTESTDIDYLFNQIIFYLQTIRTK